MRKGFSKIDILIILGLLVLGYLGFQNYNKKEDIIESSPESIEKNVISDSKDKINNYNEVVEGNNEEIVQVVNNNKIETGEEKINSEGEDVEVIDSSVISTPDEGQKEDIPDVIAGFYSNEVYNYELNYPPEWPTRVYSDDSIRIGFAPPEDGFGALNIEVGTDAESEVEDAKAEASKYAGMVSLKETTASVAGISGTKLIVSNLVAQITSVYIIISKNGYDYVFKYTEESAGFVNDVNNILESFKFTK